MYRVSIGELPYHVYFAIQDINSTSVHIFGKIYLQNNECFHKDRDYPNNI